MLYRVMAGFVYIGVLFSVVIVGAQDYDPPFGLITANNAVVRAGPDFAYPIIEQLPIDTSVVILGRAGSFFRRFDGRQWTKVDYSGRTGWVLARLVRTGRAFNALPQIGLNLPRNRDGRVPPEFDTSVNICDAWQGMFTQSGNFMQGDQDMSFAFPAMAGATHYSVVIEAHSGLRRTFDTKETSLTVTIGSLNREAGVYTWSVIPYWTDTPNPRDAQRLCVERLGGTLEKPDTTPLTPTPEGST